MEGKTIENFYYSFDGSFDFYLLKGDNNILIDTGILDRVDTLNEFLDKNLEGQNLDIILLTHSHYDHCGGIPFLKQKYKTVKIYGSERTAAIFSKEKARSFIKEMNESITDKREFNNYDSLKIDKILYEDDIIENGNFRLKVMEVPGHTRCSVSFYDEINKILLGGDSLGIFEKNNQIKPLFFSSYSQYINSMKKQMNFPVDLLALPHNLPFVKSEAIKFLKNSYKKSIQIGEEIKKRLLNGEDEDKIVKEYLLKQYDIKDAMDQPMETFMLNLYSLVRAVKKEV